MLSVAQRDDFAAAWRRTWTGMDSDFLLHSLGGGAIIAAALTLARLLLDYGLRGGERRVEQDERRRVQQRDAEARALPVLRLNRENSIIRRPWRTAAWTPAATRC